MHYMDQFKSKKIIITGGSSGIGLAIARELSKAGAKLVLIGRNLEKLEKAKTELTSESNSKIEVYPLDIGNKQEVEKAVKKIAEEISGIDILINNAGTNISGRFENISVEEHEEVMRTNFLGTLYMTKFALPYIQKSNAGHIAFISSIAGYTGLIGFTAYSPSKFAMSGLAEAIRMELIKDNINVTLMYPPDTETPLLERENIKKLPETKKLSKNAKLVSPEFVAKKLLKAMTKKQFAVYCNVESRFISVLKGISPSLYNKIVDYIAFK